MTQEARLAGRSYKEERDFKPRLMTPAPPVRGLVPSELPDLHGYVRTSPKRARGDRPRQRPGRAHPGRVAVRPGAGPGVDE